MRNISGFPAYKDYSAMQGPCPNGFHIPTKEEWQTVYDIWKALGGWSSDWNNFGIALKLPYAGARDNVGSANVYSQGSNAFYWSPTVSSIADKANYLQFREAAISPQHYNGWRASGYSVRWFKDSTVIPTSSWTKLYWTSIEAGWIFWSSSLWLISLSSNWTDWITMQDKNLWATQVWNSWDTLSQSNCWNYYQRWNNYWFPRTWTIENQSTTQVDARHYWPWNYYSSSTYIKQNWRWDTTDNANLWWWETWMKYKVWRRASSEPSLKSCQEIVAMATTEWYPRTNTIAELNLNASDYYTQLNWDGYLAPSETGISGGAYYTSSYWLKSSVNGSVITWWSGIPYYIWYNNSTWSSTRGVWWWSND